MLVLEIDQIEIDYCAICGGVWLDSGELELLIDKPGQRDSFFDSIRTADDCSEPLIRCPLCRKKMQKIKVAGQDDIILDKCSKNHGLWLNKGELESVLTKAGNMPKSPAMVLLRDIFKY